MSTEALSKVRAEALQLPADERADLVHALTQSLDEDGDSDAAQAWDTEIVRRLAAMDAGTGRLVDRSELRRRMNVRIGRHTRSR
jgi:putative addiction module component (TIGR02574 family)